MVACAFHSENHATAELGVHDPVVDDRITIPICDECVDAYDEIQEQYLTEADE